MGRPIADPTPVTYDFAVPDHHPCFEDHFPGDPLVPGALLLSWMISLMSDQFHVTGIKQCKFTQAVRPGDLLRWQVIKNGDLLKIRCDRAGQQILVAQCYQTLPDPKHVSPKLSHD